MAAKKIVKVWDNGEILNENIEFLQKKTKNVFFPLTDNTKNIIKDLIDTYQKIPCAGIAANQIGYDKSIFIGLKNYSEEIDSEEIEEKESNYNENDLDVNEYADNYEIYINPQIDKIDKDSIQEEVEGCLSIPFLSLRIERYNKIKVRYYNEQGKAVKRTLSDFMSKLFQHELDHLNGQLMMERNVIEGFAQEESFITPDLYNKLKLQTS
tara:strand:- start:133 stop:762 length:630 start_codon:yes stop_codon:yes gene_type:complete